MRLRHRLLGLFGLFAVVPFLAIGAFGYARSLRSLEALVETEATEQADLIARSLRDRLDRLESDIALLSGNDETQRLLEVVAAGDTAAAAPLGSAEAYVDELWPMMRQAYDRIAIVDRTGRVRVSRSDSLWRDSLTRRSAPAPVVRPIVDASGTRTLGELQLQPREAELFPVRELAEGFGERRLNLVIDRNGGSRILTAGGSTGEQARIPASVTRALLEGERGSVRYEQAGDRRIAAFVNLDTPPWTVLATASVSEFAAPFVRQRLIDLGLLLGVVLGVSVGFFLLLRRTTRPLDQLAAAATRVGQGDLSPELPAATADEVGHLTKAFGDMAVRLREMLAQVEASRQTAVLGRFAVELAHEIRNPLTSVKLNLQSLERDARAGAIPVESRTAVEMSLREIRRIDQALRTALRVGRPTAPARPFDVRATLDEAIALLRPEADTHGVRVQCHWDGAPRCVRGDPESIRGIFVNLMLNAIQAMAAHRAAGGGDVVRVEARETRLLDGAPAIEIRFRDEGPGIPPELRERVFHPFFTTRENGTGLGLSVALQSVQALGGTLHFADAPGPGAECIVTLPLMRTEVPAG